jgi:hypothetical protein
MYKAVMLSEVFPTAQELKDYLGNSSKLLYGNDKRKSKNTPFADRLHLVSHCYNTFSECITKSDEDAHTMLYIFDDKINDIHFLLKYTPQITARFLLDESIIDDMHKITWHYDSLKRYAGSITHDADKLDFFITNKIGDDKFHKTIPSYKKAVDKFKSQIEKEMSKLEKKAHSLFQSGW